MKKRLTVLIAAAVLLLSGMSSFAEEVAEEKKIHSIGIALNPFGPLYGMYRLEVGIPITGLIEVGAQLNYFSVNQFVKMYGATTVDMPSILTIGGIARLFPSEEVAGFFIGGRVMYINIIPGDTGIDPISDMTAGIDLGWRFKWIFEAGWGMYFQSYFGIQRWLFQGGDMESTVGIAFPIWPTIGLHFGFHF